MSLNESHHTCGGTCVVAPTDFSPETHGDAPGEFPSGATNPCKLCTPLGACLVFKGVAGCVPLLHGSQGCATYIRRYCISHYREPIDIASSNFSEDTAVFGGRRNLHISLDNVTLQYRPSVIAVATTCLAETMGEDVPMMLAQYRAEQRELPPETERPLLVNVSTPSYKGTHAEGFHAAVCALVAGIATERNPTPEEPHLCPRVALFPGMVSPADLRHLRDVCEWFGVRATILPDYSETLDGPSWSDYERLPAGGTPVSEIKDLARVAGAVEFGRILMGADKTAGSVLSSRFSLPWHRLGLPIGVRETDRFLAALETLSGAPMPRRLELERGRLIDAYVDAHKYLAGKKAVIYGEDDLVVATASFLAEIGMVPVLCASGSRSGRLEAAILAAAPELSGRIDVREAADFEEIGGRISELEPDLLVGSSKGRKLARSLGIPLVESGFPIHDRIGAQRLQVLGYTGTLQFFDRITNALLTVKQDKSPIGYSYL